MMYQCITIFRSYYGSGIGIRYTYVRLPIASTDFSTRPYTYDDTPGDVTLRNFNLVEEDNYKIEYLHQIKSIMADPDSLRIFSSSWSAPPWMKTSNNLTWGNYSLIMCNIFIVKFPTKLFFCLLEKVF
jgi:glucosylceramidase